MYKRQPLTLLNKTNGRSPNNARSVRYALSLIPVIRANSEITTHTVYQTFLFASFSTVNRTVLTPTTNARYEVSVSYTHLDVYKRQLFLLFHLLLLQPLVFPVKMLQLVLMANLLLVRSKQLYLIGK